MGSSLSHQSAVDIITQWHTKPPHELLFDSTRRESYLRAVDKLQQSPHTNPDLLSAATCRLHKEFRSLLTRQPDHHPTSTTTTTTTTTTEWSTVHDSTAYVTRYEDYVAPEPPSKEVFIYLKTIAERMKLSGKLKECFDLYENVRRESMRLQLRKLRFEESGVVGPSSNLRKIMRDELRLKIEVWVQNCKICFKILFLREKRFCGEVFGGVGSGVEIDACFLGVVRDFAVGLLGFAEAVCSSGQSYDKMEVVLGMYEAFVSVLPDVEALFGCERGRGIRDVCGEVLGKMESDVGRMLRDLEATVLCEIAKVENDRGAVHQSTVYVMEKLNLFVGRRKLLTTLIKTMPSLDFDVVISQDELGDTRNRSFVDLHLILIVVILQRNLNSKSDLYKDPSLGNLFMMNNVRYIVQRIEKHSELKQMIGEPFLKKLKQYVELAMSRYQESTCGKFLTCLQDDGLYVTTCFKPRLSKTTLRKKLKAFNSAYEEIQSLHCKWEVPDLQLREEICNSMAAQLVPAYKDFLENLKSNPEVKSTEVKNIKYSVQDFQDLILEKLFACK